MQYDDVANDQRKETYRLRNEVLESSDVGELVGNLRDSVFSDIARLYIPAGSLEEQWDIAGLETELSSDWGVNLNLAARIEDQTSVEDEDILEWVIQGAKDHYESKVAQADRTSFAGFERSVFLYSLDTHWREHLAALDHLRQGIHLRGYAQKDPKQEYRREAFELYGELLETIKRDVTRTIMTVQIQSAKELDDASDAIQEDLGQLRDVQYQHAQSGESQDDQQTSATRAPQVTGGPKVGRNDPCPCGSGKKYKQCHGQIA